MVNFEWYRSFMAVYRSGTVTGAAEARFLTQPAISQHIAALESSVGSSLFQRTRRKMEPTESGCTLYNQVAPVIDSLEKMSANLKSNAVDEVPLIRLGVPLDYFYEVGFDKLSQSPFRWQIEIGETGSMVDDLASGKLDGVIATQHVSKENIDCRKIDQEEFCLFSAPELMLPAKLKKSSDLSAIRRFLLSQQWVSYSTDLPIIRRFWHVAFQQRPRIEPKMVIPSLQSIRKAVELGWGLSVLPRYLCQQSLDEARLKVLWQPKASVINDLTIATRKVDRNRPEIEQLILLIKNA